MADELQEEPDENFDSWDLPVDWRLQKDAKKASNLGASMGIRFPLFRSLQKPSTTKRCLVYGGKKTKGCQSICWASEQQITPSEDHWIVSNFFRKTSHSALKDGTVILSP